MKSTTTAERVKYAMQRRSLNASSWARLTGGTVGRSAISAYVKGTRKQIGRTTAQRLGKAADVSWVWLVSGEGEWEPYEHPARSHPSSNPPVGPRDSGTFTLDLSDPMPSRAQVIALARGSGAPEHVLSALRLTPHGGDDPGYEHWLRELDRLSTVLEAVQKVVDRIK